MRAPASLRPYSSRTAGVFLADIERLARLLRADQRVGPLIVRVDRIERVGLFQLAEMIVDDVEHLPPFAESGVIDVAGPLQIANLKTVARRVVAQAERAERRAQVSRARIDVRHARNANVRRQIGTRAELVRHHAAEARVHERGARP